MQSNFYVGIFLLSAFFMIAPVVTYGQVRINEIAWMGAETSHNHQWIELYNTSDESIDLADWQLISVGSTPQITLEGSISAGGYYLLERTSDNSVPNIPADMIYTGALVNAGEHLRLMDAEGQTIDEIDNSDGWIAGDNETKETMQRTSTVWITAPATPKSANATQGTSQAESTNTNNEKQASTLTIATDKDIEIIKPDEPEYTARINIPESAISGVPVPLFGEVYRYGETKLRGYYRYIMGDGNEYIVEPRRRNELYIEHTYAHPGTYVIALEYRTNNFKDTDPLVLAQQIITVADAPIHIADIYGDGSVRIENTSPYIQDISGWYIGNAHDLHKILDHTYVAPEGSFVVSSQEVRSISTTFSSLSLFTPTRSIVSTYSHPHIKHPSVNNYESNQHNYESIAVHASADTITETLSDRVIHTDPGQENSSIILSSESKKNTSMPWGIISVISIISLMIGIYAYYIAQKMRITPHPLQ